MSKYRVDVLYYGKVEYQYEYADLEEAKREYWYQCHNSYGGVQFYVDNVLVEDKQKLEKYVGKNVPKKFTLPERNDGPPPPYYPNHRKIFKKRYYG